MKSLSLKAATDLSASFKPQARSTRVNRAERSAGAAFAESRCTLKQPHTAARAQRGQRSRQAADAATGNHDLKGHQASSCRST